MDTTREIALLSVSFNPPSNAAASASYTLWVTPSEIPRLPCQLPTQCITHPAPVPVTMPALSISYDPSVYITMSSGFKDCSHALNFVLALSLFLVPLLASRHFSRLPKRCLSHGSETSVGSEYSTSSAHFWASLSI